MAKKTIVVPIDKIAALDLDFDEADLETLIELEIDNEQFYELFKAGFFDKINHICNTNIDDFEDEKIEDRQDMITVIDMIERLNLEYYNKQLIDDIKNMFNEGLRRDTGVYFYF